MINLKSIMLFLLMSSIILFSACGDDDESLHPFNSSHAGSASSHSSASFQASIDVAAEVSVSLPDVQLSLENNWIKLKNTTATMIGKYECKFDLGVKFLTQQGGEINMSTLSLVAGAKPIDVIKTWNVPNFQVKFNGTLEVKINNTWYTINFDDFIVKGFALDFQTMVVTYTNMTLFGKLTAAVSGMEISVTFPAAGVSITSQKFINTQFWVGFKVEGMSFELLFSFDANGQLSIPRIKYEGVEFDFSYSVEFSVSVEASASAST